MNRRWVGLAVLAAVAGIALYLGATARPAGPCHNGDGNLEGDITLTVASARHPRGDRCDRRSQ